LPLKGRPAMWCSLRLHSSWWT